MIRNRRDITQGGANGFVTLSALAVSLALVVGCAPANPDQSAAPTTDPTRIKTGDLPGPEGPETPVDPIFRATNCPFEVPDDENIDCGVLIVAENRAEADTRSIYLSVAVLRATDAAAVSDPIVYLEGGPGGSAVTGWSSWLDSSLRSERDLILIDQRGTGFSRPRLHCDDSFEAASPRDDETDTYEDCGEALADEVDLLAYNTRESAADIAELRIALDLDAVNLFGVSYGTRLAMVTATLYPEGIRSILLDSSYPPGVEGLEEQAPNAWSAIQAVFDGCADDWRCENAYPNLEDRFIDAIDTLNDDPVDGIDGDYLVDSLFYALYDTPTLRHIPRAMQLAIDGDPEASDQVLLAYYGEYEDIEVTDYGRDDSDGVFFNMECLEEYPHNEADDIEADLESIPEPMRGGLTYSVDSDLNVCPVWPVEFDDLDNPLPLVDSDVPALVMAGSFDPITPPRWGRLAAGRLSNSTFVELPNAGHGTLGSSRCAAIIAAEFFDDPSAPPSLDCLENMEPPDWVIE